MKQQHAFTLIEVMVVVAIISILASMAMPTYQSRIVRAQISEGLSIADIVKRKIAEYYQNAHTFPQDNAQAGLPLPGYLIGNYVTEVEVSQGAIHIHFGNRINTRVRGKILTLRPAIVTNSPESPIAWICGEAQAVSDMTAIGENKTNIPPAFLDMECRKWN
jgi:type IV pilus assembly protein PilA